MTATDQRSPELMRALIAGDDAAMSELVGLWELPLFRFCQRYLQNEMEAQEVVQDVFVRLYTQRQRYQADRAFSSWLFTIAVNLCHNRRRWHKRHPLLSLDWLMGEVGHEQVCCREASPDKAVLASERVLRIRAAVDSLSHEMKTTLLLFEYEGLSYEEIAEVVGCSRKGVEARLSRARAKLRQRLADLLEDHGAPLPHATEVSGSAAGR